MPLAGNQKTGSTVTTSSTTASTRKPGLDISAMDQVIGYRLRRAQHYIFQQFNARFAAFGLRPSEYSILVLIEANPGRKQAEIASVLGIKRANFVAEIKTLDQRGLTERRAAPGDRRSSALYLTEKGEAFVAEIKRTQTEFDQHCIEKLGGVEARDNLMQLLDRLTAREN